jgi:hypothetical protein
LENVTDYAQFESMCHDLMVHCGYKDIEPLGGFADKGRDAIHVSEGGKTTIFAYSVREDWKKKLNEDARKIGDHGHKCDKMVFVTPSRVTASERDIAKAQIESGFGWELEIYGLERLRVQLDGDSKHIKQNHPQIFDPRLWQRLRRKLRRRTIVSTFLLGFIVMLICVLYLNTIPDVLLMNEETAAERAEAHRFFFRCLERQPAAESSVVVWQNPAPWDGILGSSFVMSWTGPHQSWRWWPIFGWPTLEYKVAPTPGIHITHLMLGHSSSGEKKPIEENGNIVSQFTRVNGTFKNLPQDDNGLSVRVLVRRADPCPWWDRWSCRWYVQPHERAQDGSQFHDAAELKLSYDDTGSSGEWHVDAFFGRPQDKGRTFEILALITAKHLERGEAYQPDNFARVADLVADTLLVQRR